MESMYELSTSIAYTTSWGFEYYNYIYNQINKSGIIKVAKDSV